jgi:hypothetical protein
MPETWAAQTLFFTNALSSAFFMHEWQTEKLDVKITGSPPQ